MSSPACTVWALTAFCALCFSTPAQAQKDLPLADSDFVIAGIKVGADSSEVSRVLGPPLSIDAHNDSWHYNGLDLYFAHSANVQYFAIVGHRYKTHRGLGLGHPTGRITELYGRPFKHEF